MLRINNNIVEGRVIYRFPLNSFDPANTYYFKSLCMVPGHYRE